MTPDEWETIEQAFGHAIELAPSAREKYLRKLRDDDPALHDVVKRMLDEDNAGDTLNRPVMSAAKSFSRTAVDRWIGHAFGNFRAVRKLASGGMSAVYLGARDDDQYDQDVAIKIVAGSFESEELYTRFKTERQILASLRHPYIAQLHDGGTTDDGTPYLVMEYVDGLPIDDYCNHHTLSINDRLALFGKICEAVHFAHRNLIVHRDIKPSNILVTEDGTPKLLDFGIAKPLEEAVFSQTIAQTREFARAMTPEFASPEQVRGETITTSTDVYSLGVLLYKILSGRMPYATRSSNVAAIAEAICETEPSKPSTVVTEVTLDGEPPEKVGAARATSVGKLRKLLAGDLDNIVMVTLQKDPARRYASARALFDDIERYLALKPVEARADSVLYRMSRFVQRYRYGVAASVVILALMIGLPSYYSVQVAKQRDRANLAASQSNEVAAFLTGLFEKASPNEAKGSVITAVELLEQGRKRIEALEGQPRLQAELMRIMANSMTALGDFERSSKMLERVLELKEAEVPRDHSSISETMHNLSEVHRQQNNYDQAEQFERGAIELATAELGPGDSHVAYLMARLGIIHFEARRTEEAFDIQQRALAIFEANGDGDTPNAIDARGNLANALARLDRQEEAARMRRKNVEQSDRVLGEMHPNTIIRRTNLCLSLIRLGDSAEAVSILEENIARGIQVWGENYYHVGFMYRTLGSALRRVDRMQESLAAFRRSLAITRERIGEDNLTYVTDLRGVGSVLMYMARYDEAESVFQDAMTKSIAIAGDDTFSTERLRVYFGQLNVDRGRFAEAEGYLRTARAAGDTLSRSLQLTVTMELAHALSAQSNFDEAESFLLEAIDGQESMHGKNAPPLLETYGVATAHYRRTGQLETSRNYGERIAAIINRDTKPLNFSAALALSEYGQTLKALGRDSDANEVIGRTLVVLRATFGDEDTRVRRLTEDSSSR